MDLDKFVAVCITIGVLGIFASFTGCTINEQMEQSARVKAACVDATSHACSTAIARTKLAGP